MPATTTTLSRLDERLAGLAAVVLAAAFLAPANFGGAAGENGGPAEYAATVGLCAVLAAILFAAVLPRAERPERAALWCLALGVLSLAVFWSGLPFVLGVAAAYAGARAGARAPVAGGALLVVAAAVACVIA